MAIISLNGRELIWTCGLCGLCPKVSLENELESKQTESLAEL